MARPKRNRIIAAIFALLGGSFGLHKIYLREFSGFVFYIFLMFMTVGAFPVTAILGIFEAVRLLNMSNDQFDRRYNNVPSHSPYRRDRRRRTQPAPRKVVDRTMRKRHNPYIKTAKQFYKDYALEEAAADYEKSLEIDRQNKDVWFDLACIYSLLEEKEKSLNALNQLVSLGFKDFEKLEKHDNLAFIRIHPEFEAFKRSGFKPGGAKQIAAPKEKGLLQDDVLLSQLNKLMELRKKGLLSEKEFSFEKKRLMKR